MQTINSLHKQYNQTDLLMGVLPQSMQSGVISRPVAYEHTINIDEDLVVPSDWRCELDTIRNAAPNDTVLLRINCNGGSDVVMGAFVKAIRESQGTVIGHIEHTCASAATIIFLACDNFVVGDDSEFMIHTASLGYSGKQNNFHEFALFINESNKRLMKKYYKDFLTEDEIDQALKGTDFWFDAEEVVNRLNKRAEKQQKAQIEDIKTYGCGECKQQLMLMGEVEVEELLEDLEEDFPTREELETWTKEELIDFILGEDVEEVEQLPEPEDKEIEEGFEAF